MSNKELDEQDLGLVDAFKGSFKRYPSNVDLLKKTVCFV